MAEQRRPVYTVSGLNEYLKDMMEADPHLRSVIVRGEIDNYKHHSSGHRYFSLKDEKGTLPCVMFRSDAERVRFPLRSGLQVLACGRVSVYPRDGRYQFYCTHMMADGEGALEQAFERLRAKLQREGLLDEWRKQPLPAWPKRIALITSPVGAAVRDMVRILGVRWPMTQVLVVPVRVQGQGAGEEIAQAIGLVNRRTDIDLIITGRGGGSREDLWAFNEEAVARAIAASALPVISAVGHEPDVSISDYVADVRASTPSNAAELAVPHQQEVRARLQALCQRLAAAQRARIHNGRRDVARLQDSRVLRNPKAVLEDGRLTLDSLQRQLGAAMQARIHQGRLSLAQNQLAPALHKRVREGKLELARLTAGLDAMSPLKVLGRGYAIPRQGERVLTSVEGVEPGEQLDVMVCDGVIHCQINGKEKRKWQPKSKPLNRQ